MLSFIPFDEISRIVLWGFVAIGVVLGILGSSLSLGKYLDK